jgi:hypothetical protein
LSHGTDTGPERWNLTPKMNLDHMIIVASIWETIVIRRVCAPSNYQIREKHKRRREAGQQESHERDERERQRER